MVDPHRHLGSLCRDGVLRIAQSQLGRELGVPSDEVPALLQAAAQEAETQLKIQVEPTGGWLLDASHLRLLADWYASRDAQRACLCAARSRELDECIPSVMQPFFAAFMQTAAKPKPPTEVYFAQDGKRGLIKIGVSKNARKRVQTISKSSGRAMRLLVAVAGGVAEEQSYHKRFAHLRIRGEWFRPDKELLACIRELSTPTVTASME